MLTQLPAVSSGVPREPGVKLRDRDPRINMPRVARSTEAWTTTLAASSTLALPRYGTYSTGLQESGDLSE